MLCFAAAACFKLLAAVTLSHQPRSTMGLMHACWCARAQAVILPRTCSQILQNRGRTMSDLHMMVQHNGKERDTAEWRAILAASGFALVRVVPTRSVFSVVEAVPAPLEALA